MPESVVVESCAQERLAALVHQTIEEHGVFFEDKTWAIRPRQEWADLAGVTTRTVTRSFKKDPFDTLQKLVEGRRATLVRIGKHDPNQPSRLAATMAKMFRANIVQNDDINAKQKSIYEAAGHTWKPKRSVTQREYGCLIGLAKDFRSGWQLEIFKFAISAEGWKRTKDISKFKTEDLETPLDEILKKSKGASFIKMKPGKAHLFQHYPHIPTLRLFWMCAESAFVHHMMGSDPYNKGHAFWLEWWQKVDHNALLEWEPNWKTIIDPIMDVKG